jgi:hypothetical protein
MRLPQPRGPVSAALVEALSRPPHAIRVPGFAAIPDPVRDEDLQLTLYLAYEPHYQGFAGVDEDWEWEPSLLAVRAAAEAQFLRALRAHAQPALAAVSATEVPAALAQLVGSDDPKGVAGYLQRHATLAQFREFVVHRSIYQLREADPHTWAIPRLTGAAKAALIEIQIDEYGAGRLDRMHAQLFRVTMQQLDLDSRHGAYVDHVPAVTLANMNLISLFGLHRRWRGALLGHLASFEMSSSLPNRRYGNGLRRLGYGPAATRFYDEHVEADAVHEQVAAHDMCGAFASDEPDRSGDVLFGAAAAMAVGRLASRQVLDCWTAGVTSLRQPLDDAVGDLGRAA